MGTDLNLRRLCVMAAVMLAGAAGQAYADTAVELTFDRSGTTASDVKVTVSGASGVEAKMVSTSTPLRPTAGVITSTALVPAVNGNTNPLITMTFDVDGLPADFVPTGIALDLHAFNNDNQYQASDDNKSRQYNVVATIGGSDVGRLDNIDVAASVNPGGIRMKTWEMTAVNVPDINGHISLTLTITAGQSNEGCFLGLSRIVLSDYEVTEPGPVTPVDPEPQPSGDYYLIKWKANTSDYIMAQGEKFVVGAYAETSPCFWELIPTGPENCYYVRNVATGQYLGSCNMTPASASKVKASVTPVEYYIGKTSYTSAEVAGCVWMSSTDCADYNKENGARALNKDGASSDIITWQNGSSGTSVRVGSYWTLVKTELLYEPRPFEPASSFASATSFYYIADTEGRVLDSSRHMAKKSGDTTQKWCFVGQSNRTGGYQIYSASDRQALDSGTRYLVSQEPGTSLYRFLSAADSTVLEIDGTSLFNVVKYRSSVIGGQAIYMMPCGQAGSNWITSVEISQDMVSGTYNYPEPTITGGVVTYPKASRPTGRYATYTRRKAQLCKPTFTIDVELSAVPSTSERMWLYADWDCDGIFDHTYELPSDTRSIIQEIEIPGDAAVGESCLRLRLTSNGLEGADDDVAGQVLDLYVDYLGYRSELVAPRVKPNVAGRGTTTYDEADYMASATPKGTSAFLYWRRDGGQIYSVDARTSIPFSATDELYVAMFSPNLDIISGIDLAMLANSDSESVVNVAGRNVTVESLYDVRHILVFDLDGKLVAHVASHDEADLSALLPGTYLVKAVTTGDAATAKIQLR